MEHSLKSDLRAHQETKMEKMIKKIDYATLAGGCFWGMQELLRNLAGVLNTKVGYTGGKVDNPNYQIVCSGRSDHAEAILLQFDSEILTFKKILQFFFSIHDPTTPNRQHNDIGTQYRSAIFYHSEEQKVIAEAFIKCLNAQHIFSAPVVTEVLKASRFYEAENYHQDYLQHHPDGYNCHVFQKIDFKECCEI